MLEKLSSSLGRKDEQPNIEAAEIIAASSDIAALAEIASGLENGPQPVANDCIKVMYEVGYRNPGLIAPYTELFLTLLKSRNNRVVWGSMNALAIVTPIEPGLVFRHFETVKKIYEKGSVITVDCSISVFASLAKAGAEYAEKAFPLIIQHLKTCRPKEVPQHAERAAICIDNKNRQEFLAVLELRMPDLTGSQIKRIGKLVSKLTKQGTDNV